MSIISKTSIVVKQAENMRKLSLTAITTDVINDNKKDIINAQKEQLSQSIRGDGKKITPIYSKANQKKKGFKNPNLFDTGDMYAGLDVTVGIPNDESYSITSDVDYFPKLNAQYDKAFELNKPSQKVPSVNNEVLKRYHIAINK